MSEFIEKIFYEGCLLAMILRTEHKSEGLNFLTSDDSSLQLAYMNRPSEHLIIPHVHNSVERHIECTQEVLIIKSGKVRADFYDDNRIYVSSRNLYPGDVVLLASGGHGFKMLEASEIIEVKQGPFAGEADKIRFTPVLDENVVFGDQNE